MLTQFIMDTLSALKEIVLDNQETSLYTGTYRHLELVNLNKKATVCIGVRRCGKSTLLQQKIELLKAQGKKENILYVNFFDDRLTDIRMGKLHVVLDAYFSLYPRKKGERIYCFFDELQECRNWEAFIDRILRTENVEVYISGSSAKMLATEIASQMRGRSLTFELFPFSFTEYLDLNQIKHSKLTSEARYNLQHAFESYFEKGGFPEVLTVDRQSRVRIHQEYYKTILHRDIIERFDSAHPKATIQIAYRLISSISSLYSLNRVADYLKSLGFKVSKAFVSDCIAWLEDAFFLFTVKKYDLSVSKQNLNAKKVYCVDHALVTSVTTALNEKRGYLLENMVFCHLRRLSKEIYYYRTSQGKEVDFYWTDHEENANLVQVSWDLHDEKTRKREIRALEQAMEETGIHSSTIVTMNQSELITNEIGEISIVPAWRFLVNL